MTALESKSRSDGAPERIYLQHDPEETGEPFNEAREVTWCKDKINSTDIEYVRADAVSEQQHSDTQRLKWLLDDYRRIDLHQAIGTMSYDLDDCRKAIDAAMSNERLE